jgi:hypothetical protein
MAALEMDTLPFPLKKILGVNCMLFSCESGYSRQNFTILDRELRFGQEKI